MGTLQSSFYYSALVRCPKAMPGARPWVLYSHLFITVHRCAAVPLCNLFLVLYPLLSLR